MNLSGEVMTVTIDGKKEKRLIAYIQVTQHCPPTRYPEILSGERVVQTIDGKTIIIKTWE